MYNERAQGDVPRRATSLTTDSGRWWWIVVAALLETRYLGSAQPRAWDCASQKPDNSPRGCWCGVRFSLIETVYDSCVRGPNVEILRLGGIAKAAKKGGSFAPDNQKKTAPGWPERFGFERWKTLAGTAEYIFQLENDGDKEGKKRLGFKEHRPEFIAGGIAPMCDRVIASRP